MRPETRSEQLVQREGVEVEKVRPKIHDREVLARQQ